MAIVPKAELDWLRTVDPRLFTRAHRDRLFEHIDALEASRDSFIAAFKAAFPGVQVVLPTGGFANLCPGGGLPADRGPMELAPCSVCGGLFYVLPDYPRGRLRAHAAPFDPPLITPPDPSMGDPLHGNTPPHPYARAVPGPHRFVGLTEGDFDAMSKGGAELP